MSSGPEWKRRQVEALASESRLSNGKKYWSNIEDFEEEEKLIKTRFFHRTHLKLVDKPKYEPSEQTVSMKAPAVHSVTANVDTKAVQTKEYDSEGPGADVIASAPSAQSSLLQIGAPSKQRLVLNQQYKQKIQYRPVSSAPTGEVKRTSIATFPCSD